MQKVFFNRLIINKLELTKKKIIAEKLHKFFVGIGPMLAAKIPKSETHFNRYLSIINTILDERPLTEDEFEKAFFLLF